MPKNKLVFLFAIAILGIIFTILWDSFTQPGVKDLKGDFKEVAFYRNENNTGPITRIYAVTVADTLWDEMEKYGEYMPHTKYGSTRVYFFSHNTPVPEKLFPGQQNFDSEFNAFCLAKYEKDAMGQTSLVKDPY